ncbi:M3 family metallopeptidase [Maricaulis sp.]|uniref:M3 family metallopeptidase n=1 Tax=Maricaulis sp. TaxID=1486257 RepID=UPI0026182357|nr:M3 family metallopeptidase [Maricaulis sp.]
MKAAMLLSAASSVLLLAACSPQAADPSETAGTPVADTTEVAEAAVPASENPLLGAWNTPHEAPPFDAIEEEHFLPAFDVAMAAHSAEIEAIANNPEAPTFDNTLLAMEQSGALLGRMSSVFFNLASSASNEEIRAIQREMSPRMAAHSASITLNADLFARIDSLYQQRESLDLEPQQLRLLEVTHHDFVRAGAQLEGDDRQRFADVRSGLAGLYTQFAQNEQADRESWTMALDAEDLEGLPDFVVSAAAGAAADRGLDGHVITLARSSVEPFLQTSPNRELREQAWRAWTSRGDNENANNNHDTIRDILRLRLEMANLLGYETFAHYRTGGTMAGTPLAATSLMEQVWWPARERALEEQADIEARIAAAGLDHDVMPWDWRYYTEQVRAERYDLDPSEVKSYLQLDNMIEAQFYVAERLFGISFTERTDMEVYHPDVRVWEMTNSDGDVVGLFYGDYFARPGKRGGAWMSSFRAQNGISGDIPIIINNCNYNKPADGEPALLSFIDASTLFHEFGHGLHGLLSNTDYPSLAGTAVDRDFVEFPAQIYEHWLEQPEVLERFALHYETGEPMPPELLERVLEAQTFNQGFATVEFLNSGFVDMAYHLNTEPGDIDIHAFEDEVLASRENLDAIPMRHRSPHFLHTFAGEGYSAGYYSYLWAGVLDNDGFAAFEEAGDIFDPELAQKLLDSVFSAGDTLPAMDAYVGFRGREPSVEPLLRNRGFDTDAGG